ncbi:MAG: PEP-CTERM sorting domain-containing protein [Pseudomonadota bacterium]
MKSLFLSLVLALASQCASAATTVSYGNTTPFIDNSNHSPHYLLGSQVSVGQAITLADAGIDFRSTGYGGNFGIYSDVGGLPGQLISQTGFFSVTSVGDTQIAFQNHATISAGNYWLMAVFNAPASVGISPNNNISSIAYRYLGAISNLPVNFGTAQQYDGQEFNFYVTGTIAAVPEPSRYLMFGAGLLALMALRKKQQR